MKTEQEIIDILQGAYNYAENKVDEVLDRNLDLTDEWSIERQQKDLARAQGERAMVRMITRQMGLIGEVDLSLTAQQAETRFPD